MGGALASDHANLTGSIAVGKAADLVVLDRDIFEMPPDALSDAEVVSTFLNGREIFRREP
jgi:hypothetical protein